MCARRPAGLRSGRAAAASVWYSSVIPCGGTVSSSSRRPPRWQPAARHTRRSRQRPKLAVRRRLHRGSQRGARCDPRDLSNIEDDWSCASDRVAPGHVRQQPGRHDQPADPGQRAGPQLRDVGGRPGGTPTRLAYKRLHPVRHHGRRRPAVAAQVVGHASGGFPGAALPTELHAGAAVVARRTHRRWSRDLPGSRYAVPMPETRRPPTTSSTATLNGVRRGAG
jgi:hypothetical protein